MLNVGSIIDEGILGAKHKLSFKKLLTATFGFGTAHSTMPRTQFIIKGALIHNFRQFNLTKVYSHSIQILSTYAATPSVPN